MRIPRTVFALLTLSTCLFGQGNTSHHKAVYKEINQAQKSFKKVTASHEAESGSVALTGWVDGGEVRKMTVKPGFMGSGLDEIYLEEESPLFVFSSWTGDSGRCVEERLYFEKGKIIEWLSSDKAFVPHAEDMVSVEERMKGDCAKFIAALKGKFAEVPKRKGTDLAVTGIFLGIEEGDYAHWRMRTVTGKEVSYFILNPDAAIEKVLAAPQKFEGRKCRIRWKESLEEIPEAGGKQKITQVLGVEWL